MQRKTVYRVVLAGSILVLAVACKSAPPPTPADPISPANYPRNISLEHLDKALVAAAPIVEAGSADRPLRVTVPLRNTASYGVNVQYRFEFFDARGRPITRQSPGWRFQHLDPNVQVFLEDNALDTDAADWRLTIRSAR